MGQGRGKGNILEEALLRGFEGVFGVGGQVGDHKNIRWGAGIPSVVLGPERPTHCIVGTITNEKLPYDDVQKSVV